MADKQALDVAASKQAASETQRTRPQYDEIDLAARYQRAEYLEQNALTKKVAFNTTLYPHWLGDSDMFWYVRDVKDGKQYRLVYATSVSNEAAFDHAALADGLSKVSGQAVNPDDLPIHDVDISLSPRLVRFTAFGKQWLYDEEKETCQETESLPKSWKVSPDGKYALFVRDYNLWLRELATGKERALTEDGDSCYSYASSPTGFGNENWVGASVEALWSPNSTRVFTQISDTRQVEAGPPLIEHVPSDGSLRPKPIRPDRRVAFPGDEHIEVYHFLSIDIDNGRIQMADYRPCPAFYPVVLKGFFTSHLGWWRQDSRRAYFVDLERGGKVARVVEFDTDTAKTRVLIEETTDTPPVNIIPFSHWYALLTPLKESNELIWYAERSGWAHLYLYDLDTAELKHPITQGAWLVRNILHVDSARRELFIQTAGRIDGRNPYYCDICRVNIDTGELTPLISTDHEYIAYDQRSRIAFWEGLFGTKGAMAVSPSGRYIVTTRTRVDEVPVSLLLDREGENLLTLETGDISGLPKGWKWPEPVMLKAADGETDIYGVVFRPSDFMPDQSYPVLDASSDYGALTGAFINNNLLGNYLTAAAYAELGFIVVMINGRGNVGGLRERAFSTWQDPDHPTDLQTPIRVNKVDCIAGIQQLAERYPYMDMDRVGVIDFTSIPTAIAGMLRHPNFYKVGANHNAVPDWRIVAALGREADDNPPFKMLAQNLRGKLLLSHGMLDDASPVSGTFRIVEALQQANKDFDMLILPSLGHATCGYVIRRTWDYFVKHLLGVTPPHEYSLTASIEIYFQEQARQPQ